MAALGSQAPCSLQCISCCLVTHSSLTSALAPSSWASSHSLAQCMAHPRCSQNVHRWPPSLPWTPLHETTLFSNLQTTRATSPIYCELITCLVFYSSMCHVAPLNNSGKWLLSPLHRWENREAMRSDTWARVSQSYACGGSESHEPSSWPRGSPARAVTDDRVNELC